MQKRSIHALQLVALIFTVLLSGCGWFDPRYDAAKLQRLDSNDPLIGGWVGTWENEWTRETGHVSAAIFKDQNSKIYYMKLFRTWPSFRLQCDYLQLEDVQLMPDGWQRFRYPNPNVLTDVVFVGLARGNQLVILHGDITGFSAPRRMDLHRINN
jgi:hypothetical protein